MPSADPGFEIPLARRGVEGGVQGVGLGEAGAEEEEVAQRARILRRWCCGAVGLRWLDPHGPPAGSLLGLGACEI